jgi:transcriptional regulator with XRE-family HTH domain
MGRHNLYLLRCDEKLTQEEMAKKMGVCRATYAMVERGERSGSGEFWKKLQIEFGVPDAEMYSLMKIEEGKKRSERKEKRSNS